MKGQTWDDIFKPIVVLLSICLAVSALLGVTNAITEPIIAANKEKKNAETLSSLIPDATGFTEVEYSGNDAVKTVYKENSGLGYVISVGYYGYGGEVVSMIAIDNDGKITGMSVDASTETTGLGSKAALPSFTDQFIGISSTDGIDTITGATYSSTAVLTSVDTALAVWNEVKGA